MQSCILGCAYGSAGGYVERQWDVDPATASEVDRSAPVQIGVMNGDDGIFFAGGEEG